MVLEVLLEIYRTAADSFRRRWLTSELSAANVWRSPRCLSVLEHCSGLAAMPE